MSDIFREVEEDVRQEQLTDFLRTYMVHIIVGIVGLIVAYGGYNYWQSSVQGGREEASNQFDAAVDSLRANSPSEAASALAALQADRGMDDYGLLAAFRQAQIAAQAGETAKAVSLYDTIADDASDSFMADLARLNAAAAQLSGGAASDGMSRMDALIDDDSRLAALAKEYKAHHLYANGQVREAQLIFEELSSVDESAIGVQSRSLQVLSIIGRAEQSETGTAE